MSDNREFPTPLATDEADAGLVQHNCLLPC
jgi:hypothetical protein